MQSIKVLIALHFILVSMFIPKNYFQVWVSTNGICTLSYRNSEGTWQQCSWEKAPCIHEEMVIKQFSEDI